MKLRFLSIFSLLLLLPDFGRADTTLHGFTLKSSPAAADEIYLASAADSYGERRATLTSLFTGQTLANCTLTSPTMTTPTLGVATATSINKVAITAPATSATLTIANGKTLTASNTLTFTGTDGTSFAFPSASGTVLTADSTATISNKTIEGATMNSTVLNGATGTGSFLLSGGIKSSSPTAGVGYSSGAGGTVTQGSSRTTGVTLNKVSGSITLVSAAGSASYQTFTVTNTTVSSLDTVIVNQRSGTDLYEIHVTRVASSAFDITFRTTGGTTTEQPVFNFVIIKGASS